MSALPAPEQTSVERLARAVQARGLAASALFLIELLKPWRFVAGQLLLFSEPLWGPTQRATLQRYAAWMEDPAQAEALLAALESPHAGDAGAK
jgi:hypothetical protein